MMLRTFVVLSLALSLTACGTLARPPAVEVVKLQLLGDEAEIEAGPSTGYKLAVAEPSALPGFATARFAYLQGDYELRYYGRHEWASQPARLLHAAVVRALDEGGRFDAVITPPSIALADLRLDIELTRLVHDFRASEGGEVVLAVRVQLLSLGERSVLATRRFEYRESATAHPVSGGEAANRAVARLLEDLVEFSAEHAAD